MPKTFSASSGPRRRQSRSMRFAYQFRASSHSCSSVRVSPRPRPCSRRHRSRCSSDRKRSMVAQLKPMSSHQCAAGTAKWTTYSELESRPSRISSRRPSPQSGQRHETLPSDLSMAMIPSESQMQLPQKVLPLHLTVYGVGSAEKGFAIQIYGVPGARTKTCESWSRPKASSTCTGVLDVINAISAATGARPSATKNW